MTSAKYAACARHGATEFAPNVNYAPTWMRNVCIPRREPGIKLDAGDKMILEHLARIEGLLSFPA